MKVVIRYRKAKYVFFVFVFMCLQFNGEAKTQEWRRRARQQRWRPATCRRCQPFVLKSIHCVFLIIITRPKPAYGRQGLAGSWGQDTDQAGTFWDFLKKMRW